MDVVYLRAGRIQIALLVSDDGPKARLLLAGENPNPRANSYRLDVSNIISSAVAISDPSEAPK